MVRCETAANLSTVTGWLQYCNSKVIKVSVTSFSNIGQLLLMKRVLAFDDTCIHRITVIYDNFPVNIKSGPPLAHRSNGVSLAADGGPTLYAGWVFLVDNG